MAMSLGPEREVPEKPGTDSTPRGFTQNQVEIAIGIGQPAGAMIAYLTETGCAIRAGHRAWSPGYPDR